MAAAAGTGLGWNTRRNHIFGNHAIVSDIWFFSKGDRPHRAGAPEAIQDKEQKGEEAQIREHWSKRDRIAALGDSCKSRPRKNGQEREQKGGKTQAKGSLATFFGSSCYTFKAAAVGQLRDIQR